MAKELDDTIQDNAAGPRKAAGDSGSVEQHPLRDQVEADRYLNSKKAARSKRARCSKPVQTGAPGGGLMAGVKGVTRMAAQRLRCISGPWRRGSSESRFDSAATTDNNRRHWLANADSLSADAAASVATSGRPCATGPGMRWPTTPTPRGSSSPWPTTRSAQGPRLQMLTPDGEVNRRLEREFELWAHRVMLAEKLRTMRMARAQDGEAFAVFVTNRAF